MKEIQNKMNDKLQKDNTGQKKYESNKINSLQTSSNSPEPKKIIYLMLITVIPYAIFGMNFLELFITTGTALDYIIFTFIITFISLYLIPLIFIKFVWKIPGSELGNHKGNVKLGIILLIVSLIAIPLIYFGSNDPTLQLTYPLAQDWFRTFNSNPQWGLFVLYEILYGVLYYVPYEFFWRGFVQLGLTPKWGKWKAIMFVTLLTTLLHLTKPFSELLGALFVGFLFGYIAYKTDSWYYVFAIHYFIGILNDVFCGMRILGLINT